MSEIDIEKRRRVMQRSKELGHCICDPKRPCPCNVFTNQGICPCAGERPEPADLSTIKLTDLVHNAGCASKIAPADLERCLSRLPKVVDQAIISGLPAGDDAGVYKITEEVTLVQTVDVFTPCVDEPFAFGKICAANCLSDIYAMGAIPRTALSIVAFPSETYDGEIMYLMLKGAMETLAQADCSLLGGHSIKDQEIKLGFAITGTIDTNRTVSLETAKPGDMLVLTKPLGVGVLNFAAQIKRIGKDQIKAAESSMMTLNKNAADAMMEVGVSACTDVTGFGLFGHLINMARHSGITARVSAQALPAFPGAMELLRDNVIPGAIERNSEFVGNDLVKEEGVEEALKWLGFDAQTSGGLLIAVPQTQHEPLLEALEQRGVQAATIGQVTGPSNGRIELVASETGDKASSLKNNTAASPTTPDPASDGEHSPGCCGESFGSQEHSAEGETTSPESLRAFGELMRSAGSPGLLDARTKELINFSLVLLSRCSPCLRVHYEKARKMGISQEELDEAAWCAISMGGAPVKMFYAEYLEKVQTGSNSREKDPL